MIIKRHEPVKALILLEAITEKTRRAIIRLLLERGEMTLTEIQREVGKVPSTLLFHMNILTRAGIVSWKLARRGKRRTKVYFIKDRLFSVEIDVELFSRVADLSWLRGMVSKLIDEYARRGKKFPRIPDIREISELLSLSPKEAAAVRDFIEVMEDDVVSLLREKYEGVAIEIGPDFRRVSERLLIDEYWAMKLLKELRML